MPDRFGAGTVATRIYDRLDRLCCLRADARVELSEAARDARNARHGLQGDGRAEIVPMGAWLDRVETVPEDGIRSRRVVFLGHLVTRQGVETLLEALALLRGRGVEVSADVVGGGPLEADLRARAAALGLEDTVRFHGFVPDHSTIVRARPERRATSPRAHASGLKPNHASTRGGSGGMSGSSAKDAGGRSRRFVERSHTSRPAS